MNKYLRIHPKNLQQFLEWIGMTENSFNYIIDQFRNKELWKRNNNWEWELASDMLFVRDINDMHSHLDCIKKFSEFQITPKGYSTDNSSNYILIGKGVE